MKFLKTCSERILKERLILRNISQNVSIDEEIDLNPYIGINKKGDVY